MDDLTAGQGDYIIGQQKTHPKQREFQRYNTLHTRKESFHCYIQNPQCIPASLIRS